jgi:hypothetical protein
MTSTKSSTSSKILRLITIILIIAGLLLVCLFGVPLMRGVMRARRMDFMRSGATDIGMLRGWMTIPHVARIYRVPEDYLFESLGLAAGEANRRLSLAQLNRQLAPGQPGLVIDELKAAILQYQAIHPEITLTPVVPPPLRLPGEQPGLPPGEASPGAAP